ncbi:MAG: hypothetical protein GXO96_12095 [Nitrospirae bacterium]|nr:hypothetical protein [Candidatus Manganitrophaceae bacterium]
MKRRSINFIIFILSAIFWGSPYSDINVAAQPCIERRYPKKTYKVFLNELGNPDSLKTNEESEKLVSLQNETLQNLQFVVRYSVAGKVKRTEGNAKKIEVFLCQERDVRQEHIEDEFAAQNSSKKIVLEIMGQIINTKIKGLNGSQIDFYTLIPSTKNDEDNSKKVEKSMVNLFKFSEQTYSLTAGIDENDIYSAYLNIGLGMYHFGRGKNGHASTYLFTASEELGKVINNVADTKIEAVEKIQEMEDLVVKKEKQISENPIGQEKLKEEIPRLKSQIKRLKKKLRGIELSKKDLENYRKKTCFYWEKSKIKRDELMLTGNGVTRETCEKTGETVF